MRLAEILVDGGYLSPAEFRDPAIYVELDDDRFMSILKRATGAAVRAGLCFTETMIETVQQIRPLELGAFPIETSGPEALSVAEKAIALELGLDARQVVAFNDNIETEFGYVLLGRLFPSYKQAMGSGFFREMTGLGHGNRTGLMSETGVAYAVFR